VEVKRVKNKKDLVEAFYIRKEVFVNEQGISLADEFDEFDTINGFCDHILVYSNDQAVGTGRLRVINDFGKLERICILQPYRQYGLGKIIIKTLEKIAYERGLSQVKLHGQKQAEGFYIKLGYQTSSEVFLEDGIPHILMMKKLNN
jgi:predicted GNAT family N-acyltransferase